MPDEDFFCNVNIKNQNIDQEKNSSFKLFCNECHWKIYAN